MEKTEEALITEPDYDSPAYQKSRRYYRIQCTAEYLVTLLLADAFLAKLLAYLGISDAAIGIISSLVSSAFLVQLFTVLVAQRVLKKKRFIILFNIISQFLFMTLYLIPFLPGVEQFRLPLVVLCVLGGYCGNYFVTMMLYRWANGFVEPTKRASYSAGKEMLSLACGMGFTLAIGFIFDQVEAQNQIEKGFLFAAISILILGTCNIICLALMQKDKSNPKEKVIPFKTVMRETVGNRNYRNVVILNGLWRIAFGMTFGFMGIYKTKELLLSVSVVQIINVVACGARFLISKPLGKFTDKHSFVKGIELAFVIIAIGFGFNIFSSPSAVWCVVVFTILYNVGMAGIESNFLNITYSYVKEDYFVEASAIKNSIGGVLSFVASLVGGWILNAVQQNGNQLFGIPVYGQQILSAISLLILIVGLIFAHTVVEKQKTMLQ